MAERPAADRRAELVALYRELYEWECPLAASRTKLVFGSGNADAALMFVGEAPGLHEDRQGKPFVGNAGKLLDKLLLEIGLQRDDAFITNVLKCRPPGNRDPLPSEIEECTPHLFKQIELIAPRVICTLGNFATKLLSGSPQGITKVHGVPLTREMGGRTVQLYPLFHPAAALRTPEVLATLREDFARLPALLEGVLSPSPGGAGEAGSAGPAPAAETTTTQAPLEGPSTGPQATSAPPQLGLFG